MYSLRKRQTVLIETLWNVKSMKRFWQLSRTLGFNRNIVECKAKKRRRFKSSPTQVLIETLWNVKLFTIASSRPDTCFNRNIVECKELNVGDKITTLGGFNRNIVECKAADGAIEWDALASFNRNIVECKAVGVGRSEGDGEVLIETLWNVKVF